MAVFKDRMGNELSMGQVTRKVGNRIYNIFLDLDLLILMLVGLIPFHLLRLLFYRLDGMKIGQGSRIHMFARFYLPEGITVGDDTIIGDHAFLDGRAPLKIGNHVNIASQVLIYNSQHNIDSEDFGPVDGPVTIEDYAFIGPRVTILPNVTIGKGAVVAAGAVVTKNVDPFTVVGGVPAQFIRERGIKDLHYTLGRARLFQ